MKDQVIEEIKRLCGKVMMLNNGWCHFVYRHIHFVAMLDNPHNSMVRMSIPHLAKSTDYDREKLEEIINETNREVKYIKVMILKNGSISMKYDYKIIEGVTASAIVPHMIETLYFAAEYFMLKHQLP